MRNLFTLLLFVIASVVFIGPDAHGQRRRGRGNARRPAATTRAPRLSAVTTRSGLTFLPTHRGTGAQAKAGQTVVVHYTGTLTNGVKFDSSRDRNEAFAFKLGAGQVIKGWDEGIALMRVGDRAILVIPPDLAYGKRGAGGVIPPDSTLIFIVELMDVKATSMADTLSKTLDERGVEAMVARYREIQSAGGDDIYLSESDMNGFGYRLLAKKRLREAIEVFKLNVEAYPQSANVYDSLGEAYAAAGDKERARENYRRALELDPAMPSAKAALEKLGGN